MNVTLALKPETNDRITLIAVRMNCTRSAVVDAVFKVMTGAPADDPVSHYLVSLGAKPLNIDLSQVTQAEAAAKRPRGARPKNLDRMAATVKRKLKKDTKGETFAINQLAPDAIAINKAVPGMFPRSKSKTKK